MKASYLIHHWNRRRCTAHSQEDKLLQWRVGVREKEREAVRENFSLINTIKLTVLCFKPTYSSGPGKCSRYHDSLRVLRSGDRTPLEARFPLPVQTDPGAHPTSCTMGRGPYIPGVKRPELGVEHPPPSSVEVKERTELYLYSHSGLSWSVIGWNLF